MNINKYFAKIKTSEIFKNTSILVGGTIIAQLIPILLQVILRRLYAPEIFGAYSVFLSLFSIGVFFFTLRYELSVINPKDDYEAQNILGVIFFISIIVFFILEVILFLWNEKIVDIFNFPKDYSWWLYFLPLSLLFYAWFLGIQYWLVRKKNFKGISVNKISRRLVEGVVQLMFGSLNKSFGLLIGFLGGVIANFVVGIKQSVGSGFSIRNLSIQKIRFVAGKYKEYPIFNAIPAFLNTAGLMLPIIFMNKFYGVEVTGYFDLTRQVLAVPIALLSVALSQVYLQRFSERYNKRESIKKDLMMLWLFLGVISFVSFIIIFFAGEMLFAVIFGQKWSVSGYYAEILIFKYVLIFMVSPVSNVLISLNKVKIISLWQIFYFFVIFSLKFFSHYSFEMFLIVYVVLELIAYLVYLALIIYNVRKYEKSLV